METKVCKKCNQEKIIDEFRKSYSSLRGKYYLRNKCKECERKSNNKYNRENYLLKIKERDKKFHDEHREYYREYNRMYYQKHKKLFNEKRKERKQNDKIFHLTVNIRKSILNSFNRKGYYKTNKTFKIIGLSREEFIKYLLQTYKNNYGYDWDGKEIIHIDHIIPLATAQTEDDVMKLCYYTNLQLLKAEDNLKKGSKLEF